MQFDRSNIVTNAELTLEETGDPVAEPFSMLTMGTSIIAFLKKRKSLS